MVLRAGPNPLDEEAAVNSAIGRSSLTSEFTIWSSTGCDWLLSSIAVISEMNFSGSSTSALASSSGRSKTIDTNISPPSFLMSSGRPSWARFRNADRLPVVVRFPAGPRVRLKTVDPPKGNGLGQKKILGSVQNGKGFVFADTSLPFLCGPQ